VTEAGRTRSEIVDYQFKEVVVVVGSSNRLMSWYIITDQYCWDLIGAAAWTFVHRDNEQPAIVLAISDDVGQIKLHPFITLLLLLRDRGRAPVVHVVRFVWSDKADAGPGVGLGPVRV